MGFVQLFLIWLGLLIWSSLLGRSPGAPRYLGTISWVTGLWIAGTMVIGVWVLLDTLGGGELKDGPVLALRWAGYIAYGVLFLGYLTLARLTVRWWRGRRALAPGAER